MTAEELTSLLARPARPLEAGVLEALDPAGNGQPQQFGPDRLARIEAMGQWHFWFAGRRARLDRLLGELLRTPRTILDVGCGTGLMLELLDRRHRLVGTDLLLEGLSLAATRNPDALLVRADATDLPFQENAFDLILLLDVLEHLDDTLALREARRVLRPGGLARDHRSRAALALERSRPRGRPPPAIYPRVTDGRRHRRGPRARLGRLLPVPALPAGAGIAGAPPPRGRAGRARGGPAAPGQRRPLRRQPVRSRPDG